MSEIRSVSVHLDADVAGYIAKMRLAGAETDKAFGRSSSGITSTNSALGDTERTLGGVDTAARRVDTSLRRVESTMTRTTRSSNSFSRAASDVDGFLGKLGLIPAAAIAGSAALVPLAAAAAGVVAAFAAPIAFVGGGVTLFALLGGAAIKETQTQYKAIDTLETKLAGLTKGTKEYVQVQHQLHDAQAAISPQQREFHDALETLQSDFAKFIRGPGGQDLLAPFTQGLQVADDLLPEVRPIIHAVSDDLVGLLGELDKYASTPGFDRFVHQVANQIGPDLTIFGHIVGDVTPGIGRLLVLLGRRLSPELLGELARLGQEFSDWATSKGARQDVRSFIEYIHEVGPDAAHTVEAVAEALGHVVHALAPLGPPTLRIIQGIATAISDIPIPVLTALAGTTAGLVAFQKLGGFKAAGAISKVVGGGGGGLVGTAERGLGGVVGRGVVPVYVTNPGFGAPGGPGGTPIPPLGGPGGGPFVSWTGALSRFAPKVPLAPSLAVGGGVAAAGLQLADEIKRALRTPSTGSGASLSGSRLGEAQGLFGPNIKGPDPHVRIDFDRLAASIRKYGDDSKYANKIRAELESGFNISKGFLGFGTSDAEKAEGALHDLNEAVDRAGHGWHAVASGPVQVMNDHLEQQSRQLELVGHSVDRAFGVESASKVTNLANRVNKITGVKAEQAFDLIGHSAQRNTAAAGSEVDGLGGKIDALPDKTVKVTADARQALEAARQVSAALAAIRSKTITVTTQTVTGGHVKGGAEGGTVMGPRHPYGDKVVIAAAPGEEIISNRHGQADRFRADRAMGRIPAYASGGTVTHVTSSPGGLYAGSGLGAAADGVTTRLHRLQAALDDSTKELDAERQHRQALAQQRASLVSTVREGFLSDIFGVTVSGADNGIWSPGARADFTADPAKILRQDIRHARAYRRDITRLRHRGLTGAALADVTTLDEAQQALDLSRTEDRRISRLYQIRQRAATAAGQTAGGFRFGAEQRQTTQEIRKLRGEVRETNHRIHELEKAQAQNAKTAGQETGKVINGAASKAQRRARHT